MCLNERNVNIVQTVNTYLNYIIAAPDSVKAGDPLQWLEDAATCCTYPKTYTWVSEDNLGKLYLYGRYSGRDSEPGTTCTVITWGRCVMNSRNAPQLSWKEWGISLVNSTHRYLSRVTRQEWRDNKRSDCEPVTKCLTPTKYATSSQTTPHGRVQALSSQQASTPKLLISHIICN
jgi:hypothetical protein